MQQAPYCLVLGGGGTKGIYHIGVWRALRQLEIPVNAFIGNSIGAIVSAFLCQEQEDALFNIADSLKMANLLRLPEDKVIADEQSLGRHSLNYWQSLYQSTVSKRGLDTSPLREILESHIDENAIRQSNHDFGITTVNLSDFKPREVFVEDMEPGQLINYVMASAAFPGFERPEIGGKKYIDGGVFNNVPYQMARRRGYRRVILVDVSGVGINRRPKTDGMQTIYIKNSIDMGSAFEFDPDFLRRFRYLGYLDTLRVFDQLHGYKYYLDPEPKLEQHFKQWLEYECGETWEQLKTVLPDHLRYDRRHLLQILECCAELLGIDRIQHYHYRQLSELLAEQMLQAAQRVEETLQQKGLNTDTPPHRLLDAFIRDTLQGRRFADNPYYYWLLLNHFKSTTALTMLKSTLLKLQPTLPMIDLLRSWMQRDRPA